MLQSAYHTGLGQHERAIRFSQEGIAVARRIGFHRRADECMALRSAIDIHAGQHGAVEARSVEIDAAARRRGDAQMVSWALLQRLECAVMRGDILAAASQLDGIWPLFALAERPEKIWILGFAAYIHYWSGQPSVARQHAEDAAALIKKGPLVQSYVVNPLDRLAELRLLLWRDRAGSNGDVSDCRKHADAACAALNGVARIFPFAVPPAKLQSGLKLMQLGQRSKAVRCWREGLTQARALGLRYQEARLLVALAMDSPRSQERDTLLASSDELMRELQIDASTLGVKVLCG
jgi:hypothetical protein